MYKLLLFPCVAACLPIPVLSSPVKMYKPLLFPCVAACLPIPDLTSSVKIYKPLLFTCVATCLPIPVLSSSVKTVLTFYFLPPAWFICLITSPLVRVVACSPVLLGPGLGKDVLGWVRQGCLGLEISVNFFLLNLLIFTYFDFAHQN